MVEMVLKVQAATLLPAQLSFCRLTVEDGNEVVGILIFMTLPDGSSLLIWTVSV